MKNLFYIFVLVCFIALTSCSDDEPQMPEQLVDRYAELYDLVGEIYWVPSKVEYLDEDMQVVDWKALWDDGYVSALHGTAADYGIFFGEDYYKHFFRHIYPPKIMFNTAHHPTYIDGVIHYGNSKEDLSVESATADELILIEYNEGDGMIKMTSTDIDGVTTIKEHYIDFVSTPYQRTYYRHATSDEQIKLESAMDWGEWSSGSSD